MGSVVHDFLFALRERKIWRVSAVYIVVGFGLVEASDIIFPRLQLPSDSVNLVLATLFFCFPLGLSVAWNIGNSAATRDVGPAVPVIAFALVAAPLWGLAYRAILADSTENTGSAVPLVVLMDSHHPTRVYDEETLTTHGTNADVLSDVLLDLPIRRQRESIGPAWHRDEEIRGFDPDLIVIHYSGFRQDHSSGRRERLKLFMQYFLESDTRFLIYSRTTGAELAKLISELFGDVKTSNPDFLSKVHVFGLDDYGPRKWRSPLTSNPFKLRVKEILKLD